MQYTRPATWADLKSIARYFDEAGVEYALVGGYAVAAHGFNRFSEDIDLLVNPSLENSRKWIAALARLPDGAAAELMADPDVFAGAQRHAIRINDEFTIDVLPQAGGESWESLQPHITEIPIDQQTVRVLDLEGLLKTKGGTRPRDQADAAVLRAALAAKRERSGR
ncbi:MAG TPA: nucleotidyl transferase AbiEii/AbiGii toxin family protein [Steroidobacteraceae bacterium]|nr:nucleotidyl transferase AbiEii/AbiGii toxin family protein [Steroidobacteraceae bacterium]HRX90593.1 nucleotidyl transferase AbiEii/AbiGii toxin family protein [Steroidobacteraceae bacterium]